MKKGQILFSGTPNEVVTEENMRTLYDIEMKVLELGNKKHVIVEQAVWNDGEDFAL